MNATTESKPGLKVQITHEFPLSRIRGLLCSAFEGGSNYWYEIAKYNYPKGIRGEEFSEGGSQQDPNEYWHPCQLVPTVEGGSLTINDMEGGKKGYTLNLETIMKGLKIMSEKYPRHFADFMQENDDAITADVFLQCCLFGDAIYG